MYNECKYMPANDFDLLGPVQHNQMMSYSGINVKPVFR